jgi:hypothetical protein
MPRCVVIALFASLLTSCGASGVHYSGVYADPIRTADEVELGVPATGSSELGVVEVSCSEPSEPLEDGVTYGDLICSEALVRTALRETAAYVGGSHVADLECEEDGVERVCSARVLRVSGSDETSGASAQASAGKPRTLTRQRGFDPWSIHVRLRPARERLPGAETARTASMVPRVPVSETVFGELIATCSGSCDESLLREAVGAGARYARAEHFGYPACRSPEGEEVMTSNAAAGCRAWASVYATDVKAER